MTFSLTESPSNTQYKPLLFWLIVFALVLSARLIYLYIADPQRFPISTVKIAAEQEQVSRKQLEDSLTKYWEASFFTFKVSQLEQDLLTIPWVKTAKVERQWPDILKITLLEKIAVAFWNQSLLTEEGDLYAVDSNHKHSTLPYLSGPKNKHQEVLQVYQKLSKILSEYGLSIVALELSPNEAWQLTLSSGMHLYLGKRFIDNRVIRFCKAYPAVFGDKPEQVVSVDLRYPQGMAVLWKTS